MSLPLRSAAFQALLTATAFSQTPSWQVNQPGASLDVDGLANDPFRGPIRAFFVDNTTHRLNLKGPATRHAVLLLALAPGVPRFLITGAGQILNLPLNHPSLAVLPLGPLPPGGLRFSLTYPRGLLLSAQALVADLKAPDGYWLSAMVEMRAFPPDVYVDGDYTGSIEKGIKALPYKTIGKALGNAVPGQTVHVDWAAGDYVEIVEIGTDSLVLIGDNWREPTRPRPVLRPPPGPRKGYTVNVLEGVKGAKIERVEVHPGPFAAKRYAGPAWGICINFWDRASGGTVRNCIITGRNKDVQKSTWGISLENLNRDITIEHCRFASLDHGNVSEPKAVYGIGTFSASNVTVQSCEFTKLAFTPVTRAWTTRLECIYPVDTTGVVIRNNLWHDNKAPLSSDCDWYFIRCQKTTNNVRIVNNTVASIDITNVGGLARNLMGVRLHPAQKNVTLVNNIWSHVAWKPSGFNGAFGIYGDPSHVFRSRYSCVDRTWQIRVWPAKLEDGLTSISLDPLFVSRATRNYRLRAGSPCIGTGDPAIKNPGGKKRSDMGCYGGPRGNLPVGIF